jgi:amino acid adenylation domain-containing protein
MHRSMSDVLSVPEQISATAQLIPDSVALRYGDQQLKYGELDQRVDQYAAFLGQHGVGPGSTAAICMERSFDWIVAALGIMRVGAAYVPLDAAWPDSRLSFALGDSAASVLVANSALLDRLGTKLCGVDPQRDAELIAAAPEFVRAPVDLESLAYVIYTSGSTGSPKGVEITHANLIHLERWHRNAFDITTGDRASHLAGLGFDAGVWELWPNLCAGAAISLAPNAVRSSPESLKQWLVSERITISFVPTVHAAAMMGMHWPVATALRFMLTGGDVLQKSPALSLPFDVFNNYGPTECTVVATSSVLQPGVSGAPSIGRPIAGAAVYLLDEHGCPVADGTVGEIYIGGDGVGRGYRNLPESNARCFVPDPFSGEQGKRMYRTGDRGKRRPDGEIEFCGRLDRQVKIRGQRVELDEIGSALSRHPAIEFAAVSFKASEAGDNQLVAYVLPKESVNLPGAAELQKHLQLNLPDYMIPAVFMQLNSLPLSPSAKVDPALMEQPGNTRPLETTAASAAALPTAQKLLTIFQGILHNPALTVNDNFFLAGGHSLLGMQLVTRLRTIFGVELTFQEIFEAPTVKSLAPLVSVRSREHRLTLIWEDLLGRKDLSRDDDFFEQGGKAAVLADLQQRIVAGFGRTVTVADLFDNPTIRRQAELIQRDVKNLPELPPGVFVLHPQGTRQNIFWLHNLPVPLARELGDDQPFFFVTFTAQEIASLGETPSMKDIAACMLRKILTTQPKGPYIISGGCIGSVLAYEVASQLLAAGQQVSLLLLIDAPTQPYLRSSRTLTTRLKHPRFYLYRAARVVGWRRSLANLFRRAIPHSLRSIRSLFPAVETNIAHRIIENAAFDYQPLKYEGKVLLLLAKERDPLFNFLSGWKSVVPSNLHAFYVEGRHRELITSNNVREVADIIQSTLKEYSAGHQRATVAPSMELFESQRLNGDECRISP